MNAWYGDLPAGWRERRVKHVFREVTDLSTDGDETLLSVSEYFGVKPRADVIEEGDFLSRAESFVGYKRVKVNDLAMNIMLAWKTGLGFSAHDGIISPAYSVFRLTEPGYNPWYFDYLLRSRQAVDEFHRWSYGIMDSRLRLYPTVFLGLRLPVPPVHIQGAIAAYLDSETARIDALIDRKQRFIDLLLEKRTALITHAVTKGLDPNAEMVDSGIEWIGSVPAHWGVGRLKDLASFVTSGSRGWAQYYADDGPMFLRITNLPRGGSVDLLMEDLRYVDVPAGAEGARTQVQEGDILISITAEMGAVAVVPCGLGEAYVSQHVALTRPKRSVDSRWLAYVMASNVGCQHYENRLYGGTKIQLSLDDVRETPIPIPPIAEGMAIKEHLDRETSQLGVLVEKTRQSIDLLREYRTALISAAVTGQIDIPGTDETEDVA